MIAAARSGALGVLDLTFVAPSAYSKALASVETVRKHARGFWGLLLHAFTGSLESRALAALGGHVCEALLLVPEEPEQLEPAIRLARPHCKRLGLVCTSLEEARRARELGVDFVAAKGHEAAGRVGDETTFILLHRLLAWGELPVFAWGGIGTGSGAACRIAGTAGVVLDWQLALARESRLPAATLNLLRRADGSETVLLPFSGGGGLRVHLPPGPQAKAQTEALIASFRQVRAGTSDARELVLRQLEAGPAQAIVFGQDASFARGWMARVKSLGRALAEFRKEARRLADGAIEAQALKPEGELARSHGTRFPIVQGPMTRVSDVPGFCDAVEAGGGLPFIALALMRKEQASALLRETAQLMGDRPWGVGVLGFVKREVREEQLAALKEVHPRFAIIAGGRPDQAAGVEQEGIATYLHVPSPSMLEMFLGQGSRRFIFEGRECGGHVGPRTSFVLWELMVDTIVRAELPPSESERLHVLFAGGIHDALSASMVAAIAQPLVERGVKIGVLVGTAYLFTKEIVASGAIVPGFQEVALGSDRTVLLESGPGHAIRCALTPFCADFEQHKSGWRAEGLPFETIRDRLEMLNQGRLRIASKGIDRSLIQTGGSDPFVSLSPEEQHNRGMYMAGQAAALRHERCTILELHEAISAGSTQLLEAQRSHRVEAVRDRQALPAQPPIAIVGMSCFLPGAPDVRSFWKNVLEGCDSITEVPRERFDVERWYDADPSARDKISSRWGGFVEDVVFDPLKYGIPPAALKSIEPAQLLMLELVARAMVDSGYDLDNPYRERTSVIIGASGGLGELGAAYTARSMLPHYFKEVDESLSSQFPEWTEDSFAGLLLNVLSGRVSNRFDFGGVNYTVDAACASSLLAVHLACRELAAGTSDVVLAGGCETVNNPFGYLCFSKTSALSPRGRSRAFDASADGIAISEGLAMTVLKRLEDAERDGDRIYAVIRAVGGGSDGKSKGITAPRVEGQIRTLQRAYELARIDPSTLGYVEAHATGTVLGDATECKALRSFLEAAGAGPASVGVSTVKSMIGHTKSAAGVVGLMRAALSLHHRVFPPSLHVEKPNSKAGLDGGPLYVNGELRPWLRGEHPRRAGVSSFGFGGTNFHAVLEEYEDATKLAVNASPQRPLRREAFAFGARNALELARKVRAFAEEVSAALAAGAKIGLADLAFTLHSRGNSGACRAALFAHEVREIPAALAELAAAIEAGQDADASQGLHYRAAPLAAEGRVAFLFPGQGSQHPNMLRGLAIDYSEVAQTIERAHNLLKASRGLALAQAIFPPTAYDDEARRLQADGLKRTDVAQPALGACGVAMLQLFEAFGVRPDMAAGHSYGELVALHSAGCMDERALIGLSLARAEAMLCVTALGSRELGEMLAVSGNGGERQVQALVESIGEVWIANLNSPRQVVLSGTHAGIERATQACRQAGLSCVGLPVACAFHSPLMAPARESFARSLEELALSAPRIDVYSNVTAERYSDDPREMRGRLAAQITSEVRFAAQIERMHRDGARIFVEMGPGNVLGRLVPEILAGKPHRAFSPAPRGEEEGAAFLEVVAGLLAEGVPVDLDRLYAQRGLQRLDLAALARSAQAELPKHVWLVNPAHAHPVGKPAHAPNAGARLAKAEAAQAPSAAQATAPAVHALPAAYASNGSPSGSTGASQPAKQPTPQRAEPTTNRNGSSTSELAPATSPATANGPGNGLGSRHAAPAQPLVPTLAASTATPSPYARPDLRLESMVQFQATMRKALEVQEAVMRSFLAPQGVAFAPAAPAPEAARIAEPIAPHESAAEPQSLRGQEPIAHPPAPDPKPKPEPRRAPTPAPAPTAPQVVPAAEPKSALAMSTAVTPAMALDVLGELLVSMTSELTGYPPEMLELGVDLEADLGIDSIKRVEIIGAFRRRVLPELAEPPQWFMERMSSAGKLAMILEGVQELMARQRGATLADAQTRVELAASANQTEPEATPRCCVEVVEAPSLAGSPLTYPAGLVIVTDDDAGLAAQLCAELEASGRRGIILPESVYLDAALAAQAIARLRAEQGRIGCLLHLRPLRTAPAYPGVSAGQWIIYQRSELKGLFLLLQALAPELRGAASGEFLVAAWTQGGGDYIPQDAEEASHPWRGGIAGLLKTAALEFPRSVFRCIDVDQPPATATVWAELATPGPIEIGYRAGRRLRLEVHRADLPATAVGAAALELTPASVVLATGGARGITAEILHEIAQRTRATMVLLGRTEPSDAPEDPSTASLSDPRQLRSAIRKRASADGRRVEPREVEHELRRILAQREIRRTLERLRETGSTVEYLPCDVRDAEKLAAVLGEVRARWGGIDVVLHGAGLIEDKLLVDKTEASFDRVVGTKIDPLLTLTETLDPSRLKLLMVFGSIAGVFGNAGQADYAAANETLNRMVRRLNSRWSASCVALNWGPWIGAGSMVSPDIAARFESKGIGLVTVPAGRAAAWRELVHKHRKATCVVLGSGSWTAPSENPEAAQLATRAAPPGSPRAELPRPSPLRSTPERS